MLKRTHLPGERVVNERDYAEDVRAAVVRFGNHRDVRNRVWQN